MNHINWVQQDPDYQTKYHVLKWSSSHFHEPQARQMADSALHKEGADFAVSAGKPEPQKKPGRKADREETLSMQARNHYLLDSYDRNGQYHMLGK